MISLDVVVRDELTQSSTKMALPGLAYALRSHGSFDEIHERVSPPAPLVSWP
jgi:hypothetical protein